MVFELLATLRIQVHMTQIANTCIKYFNLETIKL